MYKELKGHILQSARNVLDETRLVRKSLASAGTTPSRNSERQ